MENSLWGRIVTFLNLEANVNTGLYSQLVEFEFFGCRIDVCEFTVREGEGGGLSDFRDGMMGHCPSFHRFIIMNR